MTKNGWVLWGILVMVAALWAGSIVQERQEREEHVRRMRAWRPPPPATYLWIAPDMVGGYTVRPMPAPNVEPQE